MITKTKVGAGSYGPRRGHSNPVDYTDADDFITPKQLQTLTSLIYRFVQNEDERERWIGQICDITYQEAQELILDFSMSWCR